MTKKLKIKNKKLRINKEILKLVEEREKLRKKGNWGKADEIRKKIEERGWRVEDTESGPKIKRLIIH